MPLKIRCPHCQKVLLAEDETAGEQRLCPACNVPLTVPLPLAAQEEQAAADVATTCPRCKADVAPGTAICRKCHTVVATGKRLRLSRRLWRMPLRTWTVGVSAVVGVGLLTYVAVEVYRAHFHRPQPTPRSVQPFPQTPFAAEEWTTRLLSATSAAERLTARDKLVHGGADAAPQVAQAVAAALEEALRAGNRDLQSTRNERTAIDVLARAADDDPEALDRYGPLLEACERSERVREAAWRARAMFGDARAFDNLRDVWLRELRRLVFLTRLVQLTQTEKNAAAQLVLRRTRARADSIAEGLRRLGRYDESAVLDDLVDAYWESWCWLGEHRGTRIAAELFELAKPDDGDNWQGPSGFEREKRAIRGARDALSRVGRRAAPVARAAAGLVLAHSAPQYHSARERIADTLPAALPDSAAPVQQRLTWALARLTGRRFGEATQRSLPAEIGRDDVAAVLRWAHSRGTAAEARLNTPADAYVTPPVLTYRLVPPSRQLERDLLRAFQEGWPQAAGALDQWAEAGLGCTPRLLALLDPGQRTPDYPALAAAIVIAADSDQPGVRRQLTLWREASDQPAWVRQLAYTALGALDARRGRWDSGWPAGLELGTTRQLRGGRPGWHHFGRILAVGGRPMVDRLLSYEPAPLPPGMLVKLVAAAEDAARRRGSGGRP